MRVIGVLDLAGGRAVHARAGRREAYRPVTSVAGMDIAPGDPLALAKAYVETLGVAELYAANLDAILGRSSRRTAAAVASLAGLGVPLWLDAGVTCVQEAGRVLDLGATYVVVGLETLASWSALEDICAALGGPRVAFGLDLRHGDPVALHPAVQVGDALTVAARATAAGAGALLVIDLARVGMRTGLEIDLIAGLRAQAPGVTLVAGGGIGEWADVVRLADTGCDAVLAATALLDGVLDRAAVAAAHRLGPAHARPPAASDDGPRGGHGSSRR